MKINLTNNERQQLDDILSQRDENYEVSQLWNEFLQDNFDALNPKAIQELSSKEGLVGNEAVEECFLNFLNLDSSDPVIQEMRERTNFGKLTCLDEEAFLNHAFNHLKIQKALYGPYQLSYNYFEPYELFNDDNTIADCQNHFAELTHVSYFKTKVPYLVLTQKKEVWMSITPHEIHTMKEDIQKARGNVLTLGLGLGYYAFEVSNKENVTSVTIVEKDAHVIQLFKRNILPLFPHKEKITIIKADGFKFLERQAKEENYDYTFIDIYHTAEDALPLYLRFKQIEARQELDEVHYWIEESILCLLRRYVLTLIEEYFQGITKENYLDVTDTETETLKKLYLALEDREFNSIGEITDLLSNEGLERLARKTT